MLKRMSLSNRDSLIPFRNSHDQSRNYQNDMPLPAREPQNQPEEAFDLDATLDFLFNGSQHIDWTSPRNRLEEWVDWISETVSPRVRAVVTVEEQAS